MNYGPLILLYLKYCPYFKLISVKHINCKFIQWTEGQGKLIHEKNHLAQMEELLTFYLLNISVDSAVHLTSFTLTKGSARKSLFINQHFFVIQSKWRLSSNNYTCVVCSSSCLDCTPLSDKRNLSYKYIQSLRKKTSSTSFDLFPQTNLTRAEELSVSLEIH